MAKAPAFQFYPADWIRDLDEHPLEIEGAWIRIVSKLWYSETRGEATKTIDQWSRILRVPEEKAIAILRYLSEKKIGNIAQNNGDITVTSRRMVRDEKDRQNNKKRQKRFHEKQRTNGPITAKSQRSSSSSSSSSSINNKYISNNNPAAEECYDHYLSEINPAQKTKSRAIKNLSFWLTQYLPDSLKAAVSNYGTIAQTRDPTYRKDPANFFGRQEPAFKDYLPENFKPTENDDDAQRRRFLERHGQTEEVLQPENDG